MKFLQTRRGAKIQKFIYLADEVDFSQLEKSPSCNNEESYNSSKNNIQFREIKICSIFILVFSLFSYAIDCATDCYLIFTYYNQQDFKWFGLTATFVIVPAISMSIFSLIWYWMDDEPLFSSFGWFIRVLMHLIGLAPLVRYIDTLLYAWKCRQAKDKYLKQKFYKLMLYEEADSAMLRMMECTMESSPQLLIQLYILFKQEQMTNYILVIAQSVSSLISLISLSWCLTAYQSSLRLTTPGKNPMMTFQMIMMVFWKLFLILPRFVAIALFTTFYELYILLVLGIHYLIMTAYIISQKTTFFSNKIFTAKEIMFDLVVAVIYCVDYLNVRDGKTGIRYFLYYIICFIEIVAMVILWYNCDLFNLVDSCTNLDLQTNITSSSFYYQKWPKSLRLSVTIIIPIVYAIGLIIMIFYYNLCHPNYFSELQSYKYTIPIPMGDLPRNYEGPNDSLVAQIDSNSINKSEEISE